jgi:hypothetical protein
MNKLGTLVILLMMITLVGCASSKMAQTKGIMHEAPNPAEGESAVFGKVTLLETVDNIPMPANEADGEVYFVKADEKRVYKVRCLDSGAFGVYLPAGDYRLTEITFSGYKFLPDLALTVPADQKAIYIGDMVLDASPAGVLPGTDDLAVVSSSKRFFKGAVDTRFAYTVKDNQKEFEADIKKAVPDADVKLAKVILAPRGGVIAGYYPDKVYRSKDKLDTLVQRTEAVEEFVGYVCNYLNYYISPLFFLSEY